MTCEPRACPSLALRVSERILPLNDIVALNVAGTDVSLGEMLRLLKITGNTQFINTTVELLVIKHAARKQGVEVSGEQLQQASVSFRKQNGLFKSEQTQAWLDANHMTMDDLADRLELTLLKNKVVEQVADDAQVERTFAENRRKYDAADLSQIVVAEEGVAEELLVQIEDEGADFRDLATRTSIDERSKSQGGRLGVVARTSLDPAIEAAVFAASSGLTIGPIKTDQGYHLVQIRELRLGKLTDNLKQTIRNELFSSWLRQQTKEAGVEIKLFDSDH